MKKSLLFLVALLVSMYAIGQKAHLATAGMMNQGTTDVTMSDVTMGQVSTNTPPQTDAMQVMVMPSTGGYSSTGCYIPRNVSARYMKNWYLITPAEMAASGYPNGAEINSIGWSIVQAGVGTQTGALKIYLKLTDDVAYTLGTDWTAGIASFTKVVDVASWTVPISVGWYDIPCTESPAFTYTAGKGVYVAWEFANPSGTLGTVNIYQDLNTNTTGNVANYQNAVDGTTMTVRNARAATYFGNNFYTDILGVTTIYAQERCPIPYGVPTTIGIRVENVSAAAATTNVTCTVKDPTNTITRFTQTQNAVAVPAGSAVVVNFTWTPAILEDLNISATASAAPGENFLGNNSNAILGNVNNNLFSYNYSTAVPTGAVGWIANVSYIMACKYKMNGAGTIPSINAWIGNSTPGATDKTVWAVVLNKQGQVIAKSAYHKVTAAEIGTYVNFPLLSPPNIYSEDFYAGFTTVAGPAGNYFMGYYGESPTRDNAFYEVDTTGGPLSQFSGYKLGIDAVIAPFTGVIYPRDFTATPAGQSQINLSWLSNPSGNNVMVAINTVNTFGTPVNGTAYAVNSYLPGGNGKIIFNAAGSSFNVGSLVPGTTYYFQAWSVDGSKIYSSVVWTETATYYLAPYTQDFETTGVLPVGWSGNMSIAALHGTSATNGIYFDLYNDPSYWEFTAVTPHVVLPANTSRLTFDYRCTNWVQDVYPGPAHTFDPGDKIEVQVSDNNGASWVTMYTIDGTTHVVTDAFVNKSVKLSGYNSKTIQVRFLGTWGGVNLAADWLTDIDNVVIEQITIPDTYTATGAVGAGESACYNALTTLTVGPLTVASTGIANFISGGKILFEPGTKVSLGGYMHGKIASVFCPQAYAPLVAAGQEDNTIRLEKNNFTLYPNPTNGNITIVQKGNAQFSNLRVEVYSMHGDKVLSSQMIGEKRHEFVTSSLSAGLYFVKLIGDNYNETIKLIKTN